MLNCPDRLLDLAPPVNTTFEMGQVTIEREVLGMQARREVASEIQRVCAGIGDEGTFRHRLYANIAG